MPKLTWGALVDRRYESGVDHGVLYVASALGTYPLGVPWNGLTNVTESPSGAEATPQYADNGKYLNLISAEEYGASLECFTYPDEFMACDGQAAFVDGVLLGQQARSSFGFSYRTKVGNAAEGQDAGYKLHLIYGALASPSEKAHATINDSPEAVTFSYELTTTPIDVPGVNPITNKPFAPTASITIDSTTADPEALAALEAILYGSTAPESVARLPLPAEIATIFS